MIRVFLFFLVSFFSHFVHAETIAATPGTGYVYYLVGQPASTAVVWSSALQLAQVSPGTCVPGTYGATYPTHAYLASFGGNLAVAKQDGTRTEPTSGFSVYLNCAVENTPGSGSFYAWSVGPTLTRALAGYTCPAGQNWTLSGSSCTRPDCVAPQSRMSDGTCGQPCPAYSETQSNPQAAPTGCTCPAGQKWEAFSGCRATCAYNDNDKLNAGWDFMYDPKQAKMCASGCQASPDSGVYYDLKNGMRFGPLIANGGWACKGSNTPVPDPQPPTPSNPPKPPPCAPTEGVLTFSDGRVGCVPPGTPDLRKPVIDTTQKKTSYSDNSSSTSTETVTRDPVTNSTSRSVSTTSTPNSAGGTGQAGAPGTTISNSDSTGNGADPNGQKGQCALEPDSPMCRKGVITSEKGKFDSQDQKIADKKKEFTDAFNSIKGDITAMFQHLNGGGGALPCPPGVTVMGATFKVCAADYSNQLSAIGLILMFAASVAAVFMVLKR